MEWADGGGRPETGGGGGPKTGTGVDGPGCDESGVDTGVIFGPGGEVAATVLGGSLIRIEGGALPASHFDFSGH